VRDTLVEKSETAGTAPGQTPGYASSVSVSVLDPLTQGVSMKSFSKGIAAAALVMASSLSSAADIVDTAVSAGQFKTLVKAVQAAGLVETLKGAGPFTVFAPTDAAFAKLPPGTVESLLNDKQKLTQVLTYHVVPGKVMAADVKPGMVKTVEGQSLKLSKDGRDVMVNNAKVTTADITASNGVIHVIDTVVLPN
jgi:uncharacterized surface protein with fasciclin (FAS1) repeats